MISDPGINLFADATVLGVVGVDDAVGGRGGGNESVFGIPGVGPGAVGGEVSVRVVRAGAQLVETVEGVICVGAGDVPRVGAGDKPVIGLVTAGMAGAIGIDLGHGPVEVASDAEDARVPSQALQSAREKAKELRKRTLLVRLT